MPATSRRRERERDRHRREILEAARKLFVEQGFESTTMAQVAERAEFAVGTLYNLFAGKEDLYEALMLEAFRAAHQRIREAILPPGNAVDRIERLIDTTTELFFEYRELSLLFFSRTSCHVCAQRFALKGEALALHHENGRLIEEVFRGGIEKGLFVDMPPRMLAASLHGLSHALFAEVISGTKKYTVKEVAELRKRVFLDAVRVKPRIRLDAGRRGD
jgi:AcrR family transcriptional regulator